LNPEDEIEAAHRVIDSARTVADVASEFSLNEVTLGNWVREERRRIKDAEGTDTEPLDGAERVELNRLHKQVEEQEKDLVFLGKAAAYFAAKPPKCGGPPACGGGSR
jgi:transposase